nr:hypothetical protein CPGR_05264 [Mycolicibacter nonchromogenicus]
MVDAQTVHEPLIEPAFDLYVAGVENGAVFLTQCRQGRDREETSVAADAAAPTRQSIVLAIVHLSAGARAGSGCDGEDQIAQAKPVSVDRQVGDVVIGTQDRQYDAAGVEVPIDVEVVRVRRIPAVPQ